MRILIAEDDYAGRRLLQKFLSQYGECDMAVDGIETLDLFLMALDENKGYDLVCLDIMMPKLDGMKVLKALRDIEKQKEIDEKSRVKIIMTTALNDTKTVMESHQYGCDSYVWKPIDMEKFKGEIRRLGLIEQ